MMNIRQIFTAAALVATTVGTTAQTTELTATELNTAYAAAFSGAVPSRVSVHDPSVVIGYEADGKVYGTNASGRTKVYCVFGSHKAFAKSYDLINWTTFTNNITDDYATLFATDAAWSALGSSDYDVNGNLWAPDVIWNEKMGKWCMYMSVNGDYFYSSIVLLTSESLTGDWTRIGTVVYSMGTSNSNVSKTDIWDVLDQTTDTHERYLWYRNSTRNRTYGMNCIDPCVFYDEAGNLWMSYGSWFGGIYLLRLDESTGLRDKTYTYETTYEVADASAAWNKMNINWATSDAYQGIKIAGGNHCSGEASYIEYHDGRYWLFMSYGGLVAKGGYNMRVFSSESVTGPYTDISGDDARYSLTGTNGSTKAGTINGSVGTRLMSYYRWGFMDKGFTAQGHNSAVVDTDGRMWLVYHTRFDDGTEGHQVRVHELFTTSDGRMTCAPFEYRGEESTTAVYATSEVAGVYGIIRHGNGTDYANLVCAQEEEIELNSDGTVSGAYSGTWSIGTSEPTISINIKVGSTTEKYTGQLLEQYLEETNVKALCFTSVDNIDKSLWGYKKVASGQTFSDEVTIAKVVKDFPTMGISGQTLDLPTSLNGKAISYASSDQSKLTNAGVVPTTATDGEVTLTINFTCGTKNYSTSRNVKIYSSLDKALPIDADALLAHYADGTSFSDKPVTLISDETGLSISFLISGLTSDWTPIARSSDNNYILYLSVLHHIGTDYYEGLGKASTAATQAMASEGKNVWELFYNGSYYVTVSYNTDGTIEYYRDGVLMLTFDDTCTAGFTAEGTTTQKPSDIVSAVIEYYNNNKLTFDASVSDVVIGYAADYTPAALVETLPLDESSILATYPSDVFYGKSGVVSGISEETGISFSFLVSNVTSDWDVLAQSTDGKMKVHLAVVEYDGASFFEHNSTLSDAASATGVYPYQIFLNGTYYVTISYNPDGTIGFYRNGELMLTFSNSTTNSGSTSHTMSEIVSAMVSAYNSGSLNFSRAVTNMVVGYSMEYEPTPSGIDEIGEDDDIEIKTEGSAIVVNAAEGESVSVFDMAGRKAYTGKAGRIEGMSQGVYVVKAGEKTKLVSVK